MTIALCILGWLLSGFLAAWIAHNTDNSGKPTSTRAVFWLSVGGAVTLFLVIWYTLFYSDLLSKPFFKAKEPK